MKYADQIPLERRQALRRVIVTKDYETLTGKFACAGAIGYVVGDAPGASAGFTDGRVQVVFLKDSESLVKSDAADQLSLAMPSLNLTDEPLLYSYGDHINGVLAWYETQKEAEIHYHGSVADCTDDECREDGSLDRREVEATNRRFFFVGTSDGDVLLGG